MAEMYGLYGVNQHQTNNQSINQSITEILILQNALKVISEKIVPARANLQATVLCVEVLVTV